MIITLLYIIVIIVLSMVSFANNAYEQLSPQRVPLF